MIFAEFVALIAVLVSGGIGASFVVSLVKRMTASDDRARLHSELMQDDLREALRSRDYRRLDDWLVIYSGTVDKAVYEHVKTRRDELYVEANP